MFSFRQPVVNATRRQLGIVCSKRLSRTLWSPPKGKDQRSKYARKVRIAEEEWQEKAQKIRAGEKEGMLSILESRGFIDAIAGDRNELDSVLTEKRIGAYVGIDPTAPSAHLGHLIPIMALLWMYIEGFQAVTVIGGATGAIGDPTGRLTTRSESESKMRRAHLASMHTQMKRLWPRMEAHAINTYKYEKSWGWSRGLLNNSEWMNKLPVLEFMKSLGKHSRVGPMLSRDTARTKLVKGDGLSFAEFSYPLLQAWDWWHLLKSRGIVMQIGGADQFGNIVAGIESVNHLIKQSESDPLVHPDVLNFKPIAFTVPLLTTAAGEKFGKSAGNALWLDEDMTSPFELYQFLLRSADADVERYLKLLTLIPLSDIATLMATHNSDPSKRVAQRRLAQEVVTMIHTKEALQTIESENSVLFRQPKEPAITATQGEDLPTRPQFIDPRDRDGRSQFINPSLNKYAPPTTAFNATGTRINLPHSLVKNQTIARIFYAAKLVSSRSEGHRLAENGGAYVGSQPSKVGGMGDSLKFTSVGHNWSPEQIWQCVLDDNVLILRVGKWKVKVITIISDKDFDEQGLDAPGWKEFKEDGEMRKQLDPEAE